MRWAVLIIGVSILAYACFMYFTHDIHISVVDKWDPVAFVLGVAGLTGTISGIGFAVYGFYNSQMAEKIIDKKFEKKIKEFKKQIDEENIKIQEALQKMITGYNVQFQLKNVDHAIELYRQAVELYPKVYNGYTSLAYAYWYDKHDKILAKAYFDLALETNPTSYQCLIDLARFCATEDEPITAINYMEKALKIDPSQYDAIEKDEAFHELRAKYPDKYRMIIETAKAKHDKE
jgi:tetratricopeptide (TPR) repeat protein